MIWLAAFLTPLTLFALALYSALAAREAERLED